MAYFTYSLLGLGAGAIYAALALGLVLVYRGSGVVNFAYGAMAMSSAYVYYFLRKDGALNLPVPGLPVFDLGSAMGLVPALAIAVIYAAVLGYVAHLLMFRALATSTPLARVVAAVGVMVSLQTGAALRYGTLTTRMPDFFPAKAVRFMGTTLPQNRLWLSGVVVVIAGGLAALFRFTRVGLAIRASAENTRGVAYLGWSPSRLSAFTWVGGSVLACVISVMVAPVTSLDPTIFTLFVIPALGAALVARFRGFGMCVAAGLLLGMIQSVLTKVTLDVSWLRNFTGLRGGVPFVVIVVALVVTGSSLPPRGTLKEGRLPWVPPTTEHRVLVPVAWTTIAVCVLAASSSGLRYAFITSLITGLMCLSLVVLSGFIGQISLAQMSFAGFAGFTLSKLAHGVGVPFPLAPLLSAVAAAGLGLLVALPALRVRGVQLAIVTLAVAVGLEEFLFKNAAFSGALAGSPVPRPELFGIDFGISAAGGGFRLTFAFLVLAVVVVMSLLVCNLRRSATGQAMLAVRANERAAAAVGINVVALKLWAFSLSAFIAGLAGTFMAYQLSGGSLSYEAFTVFASLAVFTAAFIGGITTVSGAITGGFIGSGGAVAFLVAQRFQAFHDYELLIGGLVLVFVAIRQPEGAAGDVALAMVAIRRRRSARLLKRSGGRPGVVTVPHEMQRTVVGEESSR